MRDKICKPFSKSDRSERNVRRRWKFRRGLTYSKTPTSERYDCGWDQNEDEDQHWIIAHRQTVRLVPRTDDVIDPVVAETFLVRGMS